MTHNIEGKTYQNEKGELRGIKHAGRRAFNLELVREMMTLLEYPRDFIEVPFARGLLFVQNEQNYALFNVTRNRAERISLNGWVPCKVIRPFSMN